MNMDWYSLRVLSGREKKVRDSLLLEAEEGEIADKIEDVLVPSENVVEMRGGKKVVKNKVFFPGYILVKMELDKESRHFVENISGIVSFVGPKNQPEALKEAEVKRILGEVESMDGREVIGTHFFKGEPVKIVDGPFVDFTGLVQEVNAEKQKVTVLISVFGRSTPVELEYLQVEHEK